MKPSFLYAIEKLEELYWKKRYKPYSEDKIKSLILKFLKLTPRYCRIMRIMREIPPDYLVAGIIRIDLRAEIEGAIENKKKSKIKEIRFREIGLRARYEKIDSKVKLKVTKYKASSGEEYFIEFVNKDDILFGLCRLRIAKEDAMIRELHIYGKVIELGKKGKQSQHIGLGKQLLKEAEKIVRDNGIEKLKIISGVGVREYYRKLGYKLDSLGYMVKNF